MNMSVVEKLAAEGHLTDEQVERIGKTVSEIRKMAQEDPELVRETLEKMGAPVDFLKSFGEKFLIGAGATLGAAGVGLGISKFQDIKHGLSKAKYYKNMIDANPELQNKNVDAVVVQKHFDTLHKFNPEYASDPVVAGTYIQNAMEYARPSLDTVNNLVQARKNHIEAQGRTGPDMKPIAQFLSSSMDAGLQAQREQQEAAKANQPGMRDLVGRAQLERQHLQMMDKLKQVEPDDIEQYQQSMKAVRGHQGA